MRKQKSLEVSPNVIYDLVFRQSGSVSKALTELICNGVDSGAKSIRVEIPDDGLGYVVEDDGDGFKTEQEIEAYYGELGFDHAGDQYEGRRQFGRFGIGRSAQWSWAATVYKTNQFVIHTNVKARGLDYEVEEHPHIVHKGCRIEGTFYEPQDLRTIQDARRELALWARYFSIPVTLNGQTLTKPVESEKWDVEDEVARYRFDTSSSINVYNMGIFVTSLPKYEFGTGGVIVSKSPMALDMSRTQLLNGTCPTWKHIRNKVRNLHREAAVRKTRYNKDEREAVARSLLAGDLNWMDFLDKPVFADVKGRGLSPKDLFSGAAFTVCRSGDSITAERLMAPNLKVLHEDMGMIFGNATGALLETIQGLHDRDCRCKARYCPGKPGAHFVQRDYNELAGQLSGETAIVPMKELADNRILVLRALSRAHSGLPHQIRAQLGRGAGPSGARKLVCGQSARVEAWTDGEHYIALREQLIDATPKSEAGVIYAYRVLVHEYLHNENSEQSHCHGVEFFENFHDYVIGDAYRERQAIQRFVRSYASACNTKSNRNGGNCRVYQWMMPFLANSDRMTDLVQPEVPDAGSDPMTLAMPNPAAQARVRRALAHASTTVPPEQGRLF